MAETKAFSLNGKLIILVYHKVLLTGDCFLYNKAYLLLAVVRKTPPP